MASADQFGDLLEPIRPLAQFRTVNQAVPGLIIENPHTRYGDCAVDKLWKSLFTVK